MYNIEIILRNKMLLFVPKELHILSTEGFMKGCTFLIIEESSSKTELLIAKQCYWCVNGAQ